MRNKIYYYTAFSGKGNIIDFIWRRKNTENTSDVEIKSIKFKDIDLNVLLGASEYFEELRFDILKQNILL